MLKSKLVLSTVAALIASNPVWATNGLFSEGFGANSGAMAGGGAALGLDTMVAATNPAGLVNIGKRSDIGLVYFSPRREYTVSGAFSPTFPPFPGDTVESGSESFFIPNFGWNRPIDDQSAFAITVYGNGGMNTDYSAFDTILPTPAGPRPVGTFGGGDAGVDYNQLFFNLSYARRVAESVSLGVGGIVNYSWFNMKGISGFAPFSVDSANLSNNGKDDDFGLGGIVSAQADLGDQFSASLSYQSKISNTFDKYAGLFPGGGELDIPARVNLGFAYKAKSGSAVTFDIEQIYYEDVDAIGNSSSNLFACAGGDPSQCLGGSNGAGFGWNDMTVYKLGFQWKSSNDMTWRFGVSHGDQPIDPQDVTLNILAPGVIEDHITAGFSRVLDGGREFSLALMYAPEECVSGPSQFVPGQSVEICMHQLALKGQYSW
ncbi:MAG: hypothetical protein DHS20C01_20200 [marine bacterium B5-7]|nr:MAG: hypothetical protein DHS20C01_20200 [marine bacterium B5-7]